MILSWLRVYLCKSLILNELRSARGKLRSRQCGAKPVRAKLLDPALRQRHTELSAARRCSHPNSRKIGTNWGSRCCATYEAHEVHMRKVRADKFRACSILPYA